ncbi:MAG: DNA repair protein RadC [Bacteroidales bacterium]|nr:DNA repair protein RadC [Bacteroidales bacterium]
MTAKKSFTIKEWADEDRPREKMISRGPKQLTNAELVAILLRSGMEGKNVMEAAQEVLQASGNSLVELSRMEYKQLRAIKGMGEAKSTTLMAALELGWRMQSEMGSEHEVVISNSDVLFSYMLSTMANLDHEEFWAVYLNNRSKVLHRQRISVGGQTDTIVDLRVLFRGALESKATALAVVHNHPSGQLTPSQADIDLTRRIADAGRLLSIRLVEHLIIAILPSRQSAYYSFHNEGEI